jgi:PST family polysaccharide transporter
VSDSTSYRQILRSSSIIGGAQGINLLLGMVRVKVAAVLIGPIGVGLVGNYQAIQGVVGTVAGLGIQSSGVREIAEAAGKGDSEAIGRAALVLRRVALLTGLIGALAMAGLSTILSRWTFGSGDYAVEIALLSLTILLGNIAGGQSALIQGMRRIGDLARLNVFGAAAGTVISVGCYVAWGLRGILPALLLTAIANLLATWHYARRIDAPATTMTWWESLRAASGMARLGMAFMWSALLASLVAYLIRVQITQQISLEAVGIYSAAFALSGMLANVVLTAMGADYYPRLTSAANNQDLMNRLVNEQTEIGLLLAVPALLATLCLAPWVIQLFYTSAFLPAAELLHWFVLGCLGRVISWPLGFVMLALGKGKWYVATETLANALQLGLTAVALNEWRVEGAAIAFFLLYLVYTAIVFKVAVRLTGFTWSVPCRRLFMILLPIILATFIAVRHLVLLPATGLGVIATALTSIICLRELVARVGTEHRIVRAAFKLPGIKRACGF